MYAAVALQFVYDECVSKNVIQSKDNSEVIFKLPNLDSIFRRLFFFCELTSVLDDCLIVCTSPHYFEMFFIPAELRCNYMILNPITSEPYNLNSIPIINVSTETHNYNAQI